VLSEGFSRLAIIKNTYRTCLSATPQLFSLLPLRWHAIYNLITCMMSRGYFPVRRINEAKQKLERRKNDGNQ
jgi:hypothetical protein